MATETCSNLNGQSVIILTRQVCLNEEIESQATSPTGVTASASLTINGYEASETPLQDNNGAIVLNAPTVQTSTSEITGSLNTLNTQFTWKQVAVGACTYWALCTCDLAANVDSEWDPDDPNSISRALTPHGTFYRLTFSVAGRSESWDFQIDAAADYSATLIDGCVPVTAITPAGTPTLGVNLFDAALLDSQVIQDIQTQIDTLNVDVHTELAALPPGTYTVGQSMLVAVQNGTCQLVAAPPDADTVGTVTKTGPDAAGKATLQVTNGAGGSGTLTGSAHPQIFNPGQTVPYAISNGATINAGDPVPAGIAVIAVENPETGALISHTAIDLSSAVDVHAELANLGTGTYSQATSQLVAVQANGTCQLVTVPADLNTITTVVKNGPDTDGDYTLQVNNNDGQNATVTIPAKPKIFKAGETVPYAISNGVTIAADGTVPAGTTVWAIENAETGELIDHCGLASTTFDLCAAISTVNAAGDWNTTGAECVNGTDIWVPPTPSHVPASCTLAGAALNDTELGAICSSAGTVSALQARAIQRNSYGTQPFATSDCTPPAHAQIYNYNYTPTNNTDTAIVFTLISDSVNNLNPVIDSFVETGGAGTLDPAGPTLVAEERWRDTTNTGSIYTARYQLYTWPVVGTAATTISLDLADMNTGDAASPVGVFIGQMDELSGLADPTNVFDQISIGLDGDTETVLGNETSTFDTVLAAAPSKDVYYSAAGNHITPRATPDANPCDDTTLTTSIQVSNTASSVVSQGNQGRICNLGLVTGTIAAADAAATTTFDWVKTADTAFSDMGVGFVGEVNHNTMAATGEQVVASCQVDLQNANCQDGMVNLTVTGGSVDISAAGGSGYGVFLRVDGVDVARHVNNRVGQTEGHVSAASLHYEDVTDVSIAPNASSSTVTVEQVVKCFGHTADPSNAVVVDEMVARLRLDHI